MKSGKQVINSKWIANPESGRTNLTINPPKYKRWKDGFFHHALFCTLLVSSLVANAQNGLELPVSGMTAKADLPSQDFTQQVENYKKIFPLNTLFQPSPFLPRVSPESIVPEASVFKTSHLPFFCKIEWKLEQSTNVKVKFRLGEVQQVERKEGKGHTP